MMRPASSWSIFVNQVGPQSTKLRVQLYPYYPFAAELTMQKGLLMHNSCIVIPSPVQWDNLDKIHCGHHLRAWKSVWWPGLIKKVEELVTSFPICCKERSQHAEPLLSTQFLKLPWQKVASDLFTMKGVNYLLVVDYFSWYMYIEVVKLTLEMSNAIINHFKPIFARHGIPQEVVTGNGLQYIFLQRVFSVC